MLLINGISGTKSKAVICSCQRTDHGWINSLPCFQAVVGSNGISPEHEKVEGDGTTPVGIFGIGEYFGWTNMSDTVVQSFKWDYRYIVDVKDADGKYLDKFVDDAGSPYYNTWVTGVTDAKSYEEMHIDPYKYGFVVNYNMYPTVPGMHYYQ